MDKPLARANSDFRFVGRSGSAGTLLLLLQRTQVVGAGTITLAKSASRANALVCGMNASAAVEAGNQLVGFAGIDQAHRRQRSRAAPGVALDHEARRADRDIESVGRLSIGDDGTD